MLKVYFLSYLHAAFAVGIFLTWLLVWYYGYILLQSLNFLLIVKGIMCLVNMFRYVCIIFNEKKASILTKMPCFISYAVLCKEN